MKHLIFRPGGKIVAITRGGALLPECFREAAQLSLEHRVTVEFMFNGKVYETHYGALLDCVKQITGAGQETA